ncbi:MAG: HAMP domain-containing histidine kinase [Flavobacteriales bacterium]|nr:HAMP domain-containing histidine kinase [Flavobacteriales bacterium]
MFFDNGPGIPEEIKSRIFDMYYRGNVTSKGSGFGLYIVKNAIAKLNGTISFISRPGHTDFQFIIPTNSIAS